MADRDSMERYDVQLTGELRPDHDLDEVVDAIAELYRADQGHVAGLLAAAPRVCKSNVTRSQAQRHARALKQAGAVAVIVPRSTAATGEDTDTAPVLPASSREDPPASAPLGEPAGGADLPALDTPLLQDLDDPSVGHSDVPAEPGRAALMDADIHATPPGPGAWRWAAFGLAVGFVLGVGVTWWALPILTPAGNARPGTQEPVAAPDPTPTPAISATDAAESAADADAPRTGSATRSELKPPATRAAATEAAAGPFGLAQGMALADLHIVADGHEPARKTLGSVPRPMRMIERVVAIVTEDTGLCGLDAQSRSITTAADGAALRAAFERMEAELDQRYGTHGRTNIRLSRASSGSETSWMQGLRTGAQRLTSIWSATGESPLADSLQRVTLTASAEAEHRGFIRIAYRFANYGKCAAALADGAGDDCGAVAGCL